MTRLFLSSCHSKRQSRLLEQQEFIDVLNSLDRGTFSRWVVSRLSHMGFTAVSSQTGSMVKMIRNGDMSILFINQNERIPSRQIQHYANILFTEDIHRGIVISTGIFCHRTQKNAKKMSLELVDGMDLLVLLARYSSGESGPHGPTESTGNSKESIHNLIRSVAPACPLCNSSLTLHLGSKNGFHGKTFWKCPHYPICEGFYSYTMGNAFLD